MNGTSEILSSVKRDLEASVGGQAAVNVATQVEAIAITGAAHLLEVLIGEVPVAGSFLSQIADPVINDLAAKLEAYVARQIDARLDALGKAGQVSGSGLPGVVE